MTDQQIKDLKQGVDLLAFADKFIANGMRKSGSVYEGLCPFHDESTPSFKIKPGDDHFKCFGCGTSGDIFDLVMVGGKTFPEAVKEIAQMNGVDIKPLEAKEFKKLKEKNQWVPILAEIPHPSPRHYTKGLPVKTYIYKNTNGLIETMVCRFEQPDGKKDTLPFTLCLAGENRTEWRFQRPAAPTTLYGAELLIQHPEATVILVEGEKCADFFNSISNNEKMIAICWLGGTNSVKNNSWDQLSNRSVLLWPDNDKEQKDREGNVFPWHMQPGNKAMLIIAGMLTDVTKKTRWILIPEDKPNKWDVADSEFTSHEDIKLFLKKNTLQGLPEFIIEAEPVIETVIENAPVRENAPVVLKKSLQVPTAPIEPTRQPMAEWFVCLGYEKDEGKLTYVFFSCDAKAVIRLSPSSMTKSNLMMLAPINFWEDKFPGNKTKIDVDAAQQYLIALSHKQGIFQEKRIRGRGAWIDHDKLILHNGDHIIHEGGRVPLREFTSKYVYEIGETMDFGEGKPVKNDVASQLVKKLNWFVWERQASALLLAGWCVVAPFCGVLNWRPHIWITGPAGSGKSWLMENVLRRMLGDTALVVQSKTTEAGVRGMLQSDARPVLFDEADVDNLGDKERVQNALALARSASYSDGGLIGKGTQNGSSRTYLIRSCFAFSSIGVQLNQQADRSRFSVLGLKSFEGKRSDEDFKVFMKDWTKFSSPETAKLVPVIIKNARTFSEAVALEVGNRRIGDQVGAMLAGAYSLKHENEITLDDALEIVKQYAWDDERGLEATKDETQLLNVILSSIVRVTTSDSNFELNLGELVLFASGIETHPFMAAVTAGDHLRRLGVISEGDEIVFANNAPQMSKLIERTAWSVSYAKVLSRIEGATKTEPRYFYPGFTSRGVAIPLSIITEKKRETFLEETSELPF
jgi:putative DNA primase/helicase